MARISLQEQYDNKDVIHQIYGLKETVADAMGQIETAVTTANEASATATSMGTRLTAVEEGQATVSAKADAAVKAEVKGVTVDAEGTDGFSVTLNKAEGSFNSGKFNLGKVKRASIHKGTALNSIYFQLELTDGTTVRSADAVIAISGVETDIHVTGLTLYEEPDSHGIYAVFAMNDGSTVRSNTITYDYPNTATANAKGLVKGSTADGGVAVDSEGVMSVNGYADLKVRVSGTESRVSRVEDRTNGTERDIETINGTTIPELRQEIQTNTDAIASHATALDGLNSRASVLEDGVNTINGTIGTEEIPPGTLKFNINSIWQNVQANASNISSLKDRMGVVEPKVETNTTTNNTQQSQITQLETDVSGLKTSVAKNLESITANTNAITQNTNAISENASAISRNATEIVQVKADVSSNATRIAENTTHISNLDAKFGKTLLGTARFQQGNPASVTLEGFHVMSKNVGFEFTISGQVPSCVMRVTDSTKDNGDGTNTLTCIISVPNNIFGTSDSIVLNIYELGEGLNPYVSVESLGQYVDQVAGAPYTVTKSQSGSKTYAFNIRSLSVRVGTAISGTASGPLNDNDVLSSIASDWPYKIVLGVADPKGPVVGSFDVSLNPTAAMSGNYSPFGVITDDGKCVIFAKVAYGPGDYTVVFHEKFVK